MLREVKHNKYRTGRRKQEKGGGGVVGTEEARSPRV